MRTWYVLGIEHHGAVNRCYNADRAEKWVEKSSEHFAIEYSGQGKNFKMKELERNVKCI